MLMVANLKIQTLQFFFIIKTEYLAKKCPKNTIATLLNNRITQQS